MSAQGWRIRGRPLLLAALCAASPGIITGQGLPRTRAGALGFSADGLTRIDSVMQAYVEGGKVPGVVTLIVRHGRIVQLGTYGFADREAGRRMAADALFRIASQSKAITTVGIMLLIEEGKLRLHDPVSRWLPSFATATVAVRVDTGVVRQPLARPITIKDLLTHTAGISYGTDSLVRELYRPAGLGPAAGYGWCFADKSEPICVLMDRLGTLPFVAQPGSRFVYGYSTDILGCVIERASGEPLDRFIARRITGPLRMRDTHFFVPPADLGRLTAVYAATDSGLRRAPDGELGQGAYVDGPRATFSGGAGLVSTARDYARFLQMLLNRGVLDGARILRRETVAQMTTDQIDSVYGMRGVGFGLGFEILEDPGLAGRSGSAGMYSWAGAYGSTYWVDPAEDLVAVFMIQEVPRGSLDLSGRFRTLVYQALIPP